MTLLIHIVGESDLGMERQHGQNDDNASRNTWSEVSRYRQEKLEDTDDPEKPEDTDDPETRCRYLSETAAWKTVLPEDVQDGFAEPKNKSLTPLANEIRLLKEDPAQQGRPIRVVLVGVGNDKGTRDTGPLARLLQEKLKAIKEQTGSPFALQFDLYSEAIVLPGLTQEQCPKKLDELLNKEDFVDEDVVLPIAGGPNQVVAQVAGLLNARRPGKWKMLLAKTQTDEQSDSMPDGDGSQQASKTPFYQVSGPKNPSRGWLLGLGLPTVYGRVEGDSLDDDIKKVIELLDKAYDHEGAHKPDADERLNALRLMLLLDIARGDLASALTLRAWICADKNRNGQVRHESRLKEAGASATHDFASLTGSREADDLRDLIWRATRVDDDPIPEWLSWPNENICLIYGQGIKAEAGDGNKKSAPFGLKFLKASSLEKTLRPACQVTGTLRLHLRILASEESRRFAHEDIKIIKSDAKNAEVGATLGTPKTIDYGTSFNSETANVETIKEKMRDLRGDILQSLEEIDPKPRAIAVGTTGEKECVVAALEAAQQFGGDHGIPVFLVSWRSTSESGSSSTFDFHQFGVSPKAAEALKQSALHCLERLDLRTVARLLEVGTPEMMENAQKAVDLANELCQAVNADDIDAYAHRIFDVFGVIAQLTRDSNITEEAKCRLATIAAELVNPPKEGKTPVLLARADSSNTGEKLCCLEEATLWQLLRMLYQVRNKLSTNHGSLTLEDSFGEVCGKRVEKASADSRELKYPDFLQLIVDKGRTLIDSISDEKAKREEAFGEVRKASNWAKRYWELHAYLYGQCESDSERQL